ncbi:response regulator [Aquibium carbonis]|uniref:Response regulator n=1 Tax=Aquibium carbonis TaxID=2495581 RepID=A0A429Z1G7_9HYPH|nr:response regulator [Aquibium carbonis]RST87474.1 response regulator [Aquibium carbonis]
MDELLTKLAGMRILIAEDEYLLAAELAQFFESVGATVLGPASDVPAARTYLDEADAAILDINLRGSTVFPIADELFLRGVPFVFFSGTDGSSLPDRFRFVGSLPKPVSWQHVLSVLDAEIGSARGNENPFEPLRQDMGVVLPKLRLSARLMLGDAFAADRLVEKTLERAVGEFKSRPDDMPTSTWLTHLMETTLAVGGRNLMN